MSLRWAEFFVVGWTRVLLFAGGPLNKLKARNRKKGVLLSMGVSRVVLKKVLGGQGCEGRSWSEWNVATDDMRVLIDLILRTKTTSKVHVVVRAWLWSLRPLCNCDFFGLLRSNQIPLHHCAFLPPPPHLAGEGEGDMEVMDVKSVVLTFCT